VSGATVSYTESELATTTFTVEQSVRGVRSGRRCIAAPRKPTRNRRRSCIRYLQVGHFTHRDEPGSNRFRFTGRLNHRKLARGSYRLDATPRAGSVAGATASVLFRITG
jgi:hypothetical protein